MNSNESLAYEYIKDIPWDKNPTFAFSGDTNTYISAFKNIVNTIPVNNMKISFNEDIWDFNTYIQGVSNEDYKFIFTDIPKEIKNYCKFFVLYGILNKRKISTINNRFKGFKSIYLKICDYTAHKSLLVITTQDIINEINRRNVSASRSHNLYESIYQFYDFLFKNYKINTPVEIKKIKEFGIKEKNISKKLQDENKISNIPEEYFLKIFNTCLNLMRNEKINYSARMTAALIIILSQTGLRISDLLCLKIDDIIETKLPKTGHKVNYIHFTSKKPSKAYAPLLEFDIFSNPITTEAYYLMIELRKSCETSKDHNYLYSLPISPRSKNVYPIQKQRFYMEYQKLMYEFLPNEIKHSWPGIAPCLYMCKKEKINIYIPDARQYRVHLCTALYEKGVPLVYIQKYMGHLSESMLGYYVRPKDTYQENIEYSEKVIKEIVEEDLTPLGGSFMGDDIRKNIQKFIKENNLNVKTNIDEVMKELGSKVIIRGKTGGVCIKTSLMPCSKDARTNEMMCAYNLCPNLFHFYYMIDVNYMNFKTLQDTYKSNKENGNTRAAQKELNKVKDFLRRRLIPELDELEKELDKKGFDTITEQHPSLIEIIENKDDIRKEIELWMNKN